jgi:capsular exopolysaccharide synthesis family protein
MEMLDTGLTTAEDVERRLDVAHLGSLPHLASVADEKNISPVEYVVAKPLSSFAEAFRSLRTSIRYSRLGERVKTIMVTSSRPGEGKTTSTVCLGRVAAQSGDKVVIVDCDLRRRNINRLIGVEADKGLLEVLAGQARIEEVLLQDEESGAYILPLAHSSYTPKDVFGTAAMDRLLADLAARFDLVLLDTAPTLAVADTRALAAKCDAVVFLARWRKTPDKAIESALRMLSAAGAHIAGVALTQVNMKEQVRYGYGDPGYYYGEYKKYYAS